MSSKSKGQKSKVKGQRSKWKTKADIEFTEKANNTFELKVSIPWEEVEEKYQAVLKQLAKEVEAEGFRKGKVPPDVAEEKIGKEKVFQHVIQQVVPPVYGKAVQEHALQPVTSPNVQPLKVAKDNDWVLKIISCEAPEVELKDYQKKVKQTLAGEKLWTPEDGKPEKQEEQDTRKEYNKKLNKVMETLLDYVDLELSDFLLKRETNRSLSKFLDQIEQMDVQLEDYLASKELTSEELREQHEEKTKRTLKLEFILQEIIKDADIQVEKEEIDQALENVSDKETKKRLDTPREKAYLSSILAKRKAIDFLLSL